MKILVILASGIGNSILFGPTLKEIRKNHPQARIDLFVTKKAFAEPFTQSNLINKVYSYNGVKTLIELRKQKYDTSITAFPSNRWQFNLFAFIVGAKLRITHAYKVGKIKTLSFLQNKKTLAKIINGIDEGVDENLANIDKDLDFAVTARRRFTKGNDYKRREIISYLGSNLILTDHSLGIELRKPLELMAEIAKEVNEAMKKFEPLEKADNSEQFKLFLSENPVMGRVRQLVRKLYQCYEVEENLPRPLYLFYTD